MMATNNSCNYSPTQFNVLSGGASGNINNISPGSAGDILTSNGASAQPTFQPPAGGGGGITVQAWVIFTVNSSLGIAISSQFNVSSVTISGSNFRVNFTSPVATPYIAFATNNQAPSNGYQVSTSQAGIGPNLVTSSTYSCIVYGT